ncbi:MAG: DUF1349 domain-containing protein [Anaerolineae bacterium]|nr:DUF1349 domain-containing protein [Anaerolineae bacterium]
MFKRLALFTIGLLIAAAPLRAQDDPCTREAVIVSFAQAGDIDAWVGEYTNCPVFIQRAVRQLATGYQLLGSEYLPFGAAGEPFTFSSIWTWYQGSAGGLVHNIDAAANSVTLIADVQTEQRDAVTTAPVLAYATTGNFTTQVKMNFDPLADENGAGLGMRAAQDLAHWLRIVREGDDIVVSATQAGATIEVERLPYEEGEDDVYFRLTRAGTLYTLAYSVDAKDWRALVTDYAFDLPDEVEIFLTVYSPPGVVAARFSEMKID